MRSALGVVGFWALGILGLAGACLGSVAFIGKQIDDTTVAVGYTLTPEQITARLEAARRAFEALSPAQHLDAARVALTNTDPREEPRALDEALRHLAAIAATAPERPQVVAALAEIDRRRVSMAQGAGAFVERFGIRHPTTAAPAEALEQRTRIARMLDRRGRAGSVRAVGEESATLQFETPLCGAPWLASLTSPGARAVLRRVGISRVQCAAGGYGFAP